MKKLLFVVSLFLMAFSLYAQQVPLMKIYMDDGSTKQYNLKDIDSLGIIDNKNFYDMKIHYQDSLIAYYPTEIIGSIKIENDTNNNKVLNVYLFGYPKTYILSSIDSIIFYKDIYQPLTIGSQVWMLKNLNVDHYRNGDSILEVKDKIEWNSLKTGAWCFYNNDTAMGAIYGKLYNWYAVSDPRALAPEGWHVSSDGECATLTIYLGGANVAGGKLKTTGTIEDGDGLWKNPNTGATNKSGFSALPGGYRNYFGTFGDIRYNGSWWSATEMSTTSAWNRDLNNDSADYNKHNVNKPVGFSVRCIKDK